MNESAAATALRLAHIADELRAQADNAQRWSENPYDIVRFERIRELAAELQHLADTRPLDEIQAIFSTEIDWRTPLAVVDTAVIDEFGQILLIRRADDGLWAMPGGACEVGETPAAAGAREVLEETGITVEITRLLGVFDSKHCGTVSSRHLYHVLFTGVPLDGGLTPSIESPEVRWFSLGDIPWTELSPGHEFRLQHVMNWWLSPGTKAYFDRG